MAVFEKYTSRVKWRWLICYIAALIRINVFVCLQASQPDELTIEEQEILEVIDDGDMEDWVKVQK